MLHDHRLWGIRRKTVVPAFSLGLFIACLPFPGHFVSAALAALALRINIPVAAVATIVINPLTVGPVFYFEYQLGALLLSIESGPPRFELSIDWVTHTLVSIWQPMLLGSVLVGSVVALLSFVVLDAMWRNSLANYKARKRSGRS
jgi:uncharacterized protein (DUF2062 family)